MPKPFIPPTKTQLKQAAFEHVCTLIFQKTDVGPDTSQINGLTVGQLRLACEVGFETALKNMQISKTKLQ